MKQLILTFFAVILCYSLFFDQKTEKPAVDEIKSIYESPAISETHPIAPDSMFFLTLYHDDGLSWSMMPD